MNYTFKIGGMFIEGICLCVVLCDVVGVSACDFVLGSVLCLVY